MKIILNGKTYTAPNPKVKLWREITKFKEVNEGKDVNEVLDDILTLISGAFKNPEVTPESIEENMDLEDILPTWLQVVDWVNQKINSKMTQLPNQVNPTEK